MAALVPTKNFIELGLESLDQWPWYRKLCYFLKLTKNKSPKYLFKNIRTVRSTHTEQETWTIFLNSRLGILFSEIHTSHPL